jgi:metallo-beta-lactamase class B
LIERLFSAVAIAALAVAAVSAQQRPSSCEACPAWNAPQRPFRILGNVYYVGPRGLGVILVTSEQGHVLLDGALPESVPAIVSSIRTLGFRVEDVRLIVNSHPHFDHAGGIGELQRLSGATVAALAPSARVLGSGRSGPDDPQFGVVIPIEPSRDVQVVAPGGTLRVGPLAFTAHATGGHTPGGTTWTWRSCEEATGPAGGASPPIAAGGRCFDMVYADSQTAVSADGFLFTNSKTYPTALQDFEKGLATLSRLPCDVLLTPHAEASDLWGRIARRDRGGGTDALVDRTACRRYAETARTALRARVEREQRTGK